MTVFARRRRIQTLVATVLLLFVVSRLYPLSGDADSSSYHFGWHPHGKGRPALALPPDYDPYLEPAVSQSEYCNERFTPKYLDDFRTHAIQYCAAGSTASLRCFQGHSRDEGAVDSLCIGQGATLDLALGQFTLDCELRNPDKNETNRGLIPFDQIKPEWYESGPRWIFDHHLKVQRGPSDGATTRSASEGRPGNPQFALLVKRECNSNIWHCLMEIWTMMLTFDLLRTTPDPSRQGAAFFSDVADLTNTQAIVLDDLSDGHLMDLWTIFTGRPPVRLADILDDPEQARAFAEVPRNVIVPLAGAANPLWQNDWVDHDCGHAPTLRTFVRRVEAFYGISAEEGEREGDSPITLTFVNRTGSRKLADQEALLAAVAAKHPHVRIQSVDFATLSFPEQIRVARATDVLLGVHGAGLTHTMFMRDGRGAVVEIRPATNDYRGFRNLAFMKGLHYFTALVEQIPARGKVVKRDSWHWDDVRIGLDEFMGLVDAAIAAVSH
ncbi:uncharacterized protein B0H64DRAFT_329608 [Chaetomium fimeti]|uniref:EGF domain-specific O-linked N-acetylglucosamine transferase n=1 Tax=Chaetomium fimeti TaxID=1854472 RepID=A0AAE0LNK3_9PEZI|nr:hypothetical protein B0H64DRAFT_329608 [Chaetomium fimeti]